MRVAIIPIFLLSRSRTVESKCLYLYLLLLRVVFQQFFCNYLYILYVLNLLSFTSMDKDEGVLYLT